MLIIFPVLTRSQIVFYADSVISFSSQFGLNNWSAKQALGMYDTYPDYGDIVTAWASQSQDDQREFIELYYGFAMPLDSIFIFETYNPGAVDTVYVKNPVSGGWEIVYQGTVDTTIDTSRIFKIGFPRTPFLVSEIRLALNSPAIPGWNEIDAVAVIKKMDSSSGSNPGSGSGMTLLSCPGGNEFYILFPDDGRDISIHVADITGKMVRCETVESAAGVVRIYLKEQPAGIYFASVISGGRWGVFKLIKVR